ncbi:MAG: Heavy metal translocating P-type ATPase [candidate division TM6 bacterium GW2011_GWE2_36_25]|nr:MAG: Heavy metal translocating P-type ATPase [candidate division TM6 bacterium GW2011_GWF2_36_131]KKQ03488.1 MAG: Heavy metal translocating P-type ATPase [candidate division TM6 bacterium GW2011_GWE2_36_25]KKQ20238.1 MAG: Heavy metal translocating P-type ATPase [candidate division TM6 bacterium GW2011_GWA2_36_9]
MMKQSRFRLHGMHCPSCVESIEKELKKLSGFEKVGVNFTTESLVVLYDDQKISADDIIATVKKMGYHAQEEGHKHEHMVHEDDGLLRLKIQVIVSLIITVLLSLPMFVDIPFIANRWVQLVLASIVQFGVGYVFYKQFWLDLKNRSLGMYTLIALGTSVAYGYSTALVLFPTFFESIGIPLHYYFDSAVTIIAFILLGYYLEARARKNMSGAIESLLKLRPDIATKQVKVGDGVEWQEIPIDHVHFDDILLVKTGQRIPADGEIIEGESSVDESMITGESESVAKKVGSKVIGGTVNLTGSFIMRALQVGETTTLAKIIRLVEEAQSSQIPVQRIVHKISAIFVPIVICVAIVTFVVWLFVGLEPRIVFAIVNMVAVLIIACPCALGLATPTSIMVGINRAALSGILIRNATVLELMKKINVMVFDKTGTLTKAKRAVKEVYFTRELDKLPLLQNKEFDSALQYICSLIYSIEKSSSHPVAHAIVQKIKEKNLHDLPVKDFVAFVGRGATATVNEIKVRLGSYVFLEEAHIIVPPDIKQKMEEFSKDKLAISFVALNGTAVGVFGIQDTIQSDAKELIDFLKQKNIQPIMITGDNEINAHYVAQQLGIKKVFAKVLPEEKQDIVKQFKEAGNLVAMVGDGINDAPALVEADIGIAMGEGTDVAIESADVVLLGDNLALISQLYKLSSATIANIYQNLFWAFSYNIILIPVATGIFYPWFHIMISPVLAGAAMALSSISVVINALRLKFVRL